jgi:transcriptional regulator with XRE-family HTH domain
VTSTDIDDIGLRAACELVQDVVIALTEQLAGGDVSSVSKRELARRAGVGQATSWPLLNGRLWARADTLMRASQAAGVNLGGL